MSNILVSKKRKVACMTAGKTCGLASTVYPKAPKEHFYQGRTWLSHQPMVVKGCWEKCSFLTNGIKCSKYTNMIDKLCQRHLCRFGHPTQTCWQDHITQCVKTQESYSTSNFKKLGEHQDDQLVTYQVLKFFSLFETLL